jgi:hypothetical protein
MPRLLIQVEHYLDRDPRRPEAYNRFMARMQSLEGEIGKWASVVLDDVTWMELGARRLHQYHLNPTAKDPRQWFGGSTDLLEEMMQTVGALPCVVGIAAHVAQEKDDAMGFILRGPAAPGRLATRQQLMSAFSEVYHTSLVRNEEGNVVYQIQTNSDQLWAAQSHIRAPNPCDPHWESLWVNWKNGPRPTCKVLVYGDPGSGKTTFLSTFPTPLLACSFDPFGKEIPYLVRGNTVVDSVDSRGTPVRQVFSGAVKPR